MEAQDSGLLLLDSPGSGGEAPGGGQGPVYDEGSRPSHHEADAGTEHQTGRGATS
jgi:hypothetical protein